MNHYNVSNIKNRLFYNWSSITENRTSVKKKLDNIAEIRNKNNYRKKIHLLIVIFVPSFNFYSQYLRKRCNSCRNIVCMICNLWTVRGNTILVSVRVHVLS